MTRLRLAAVIVLLGLVLPHLPARAVEPTATVSFYTTPPGADVFLDGLRLGETPMKSWSVQAGPHTIRFSRSGYHPVTFSFTAKVGKRYDLRRKLQSVTSKPPPKKKR